MKRVQTRGIVLRRTDYGEADRILTILTPNHGKLRLMARGVRKPKAKLAGSIELFGTADVTFIKGRGEIGTLMSARLIKHYGHIVEHFDRVQLGYELIKTLNRATEDHPEPEYYELLEQAFAALDDPEINLELVQTWFGAQLLKLAGHSPNLKTDTAGSKLDSNATYNFDFDVMAFTPHATGKFTAAHIKVLRLLFSSYPPQNINKVQGLSKILKDLSPLVHTMLTSYIRV